MFSYCNFLELNPQVEKYLEEHLFKSLSSKSTILESPASGKSKVKHLKRKMSIRGAVKKTRSINIDGENKFYLFGSSKS